MTKHAAHYVGANNGNRNDFDLYETPEFALQELLKSPEYRVVPEDTVWEPACGRGAIARVLSSAGQAVMATDLHDYGYGTGGLDFFSDAALQYGDKADAIVTNPPYQVRQNGRIIRVEDWIERALSFYTVHDVYMLLKTTALAGKKRSAVMETHLRHVIQFRGRFSMGKPGQTMIDFAWFCFSWEWPGDVTISWADI